MSKKWVKVPGPGQYRGEGEWIEVDDKNFSDLEGWKHHRETGFLPTAEQDKKPTN